MKFTTDDNHFVLDKIARVRIRPGKEKHSIRSRRPMYS